MPPGPTLADLLTGRLLTTQPINPPSLSTLPNTTQPILSTPIPSTTRFVSGRYCAVRINMTGVGDFCVVLSAPTDGKYSSMAYHWPPLDITLTKHEVLAFVAEYCMPQNNAVYRTPQRFRGNVELLSPMYRQVAPLALSLNITPEYYPTNLCLVINPSLLILTAHSINHPLVFLPITSLSYNPNKPPCQPPLSYRPSHASLSTTLTNPSHQSFSTGIMRPFAVRHRSRHDPHGQRAGGASERQPCSVQQLHWTPSHPHPHQTYHTR